MHRGFLFKILIITMFFHGCKTKEHNPIKIFLKNMPDEYRQIVENPEKYRLQIIYTKIDRTKENKPELTTYAYRVNDREYFYPASTVKMPVAFLALEKLNELNIKGLDKYCTMLTDSAFSGQIRVYTDSTAENGKPSVAHYIRKIFILSDNDAFNRLYEFVGQQRINQKLRNKGFTSSRITHRLSIPLNIEENAVTNPVKFLSDGELLYEQPMAVNKTRYYSNIPVFAGEKNMVNDSILNEPREFTYSNCIPLDELHDILVCVIFPEIFPLSNKFMLSDNDYEFLYQYMSQYPSETMFPDCKDYDDNYCKFLLFGNRKGKLPRPIRIFNKVGEAYGFLTDVAYIVDFNANIEFFLAATIYVNEDEIVNDGVYDYETIGYPFLHDLGEVIYNHELNRKRENIPDLTKFKVEYDQ